MQEATQRRPGKAPYATTVSGTVSPKRSRLVYIPIDKLTPDPRNPRKHSREQIRAIARSIEAHGFNAPILIDKRGQIIAGEGRYGAAKLLGLSEVPVIRLDHLSETQARAYMIADNKLTDRSSWDDSALALHLKELSELAAEIDVELTGFELPEIDLRIQSLDDPLALDGADDFKATVGPVVSRQGDVWCLREHRLLCGSSIDELVYPTVLGNSQASAVFTDPPYNVKIDGNVCGKGAIKHREFAMASGEMSKSEFTDFLSTFLKLVGAHTTQGALVYACMDWRHLGELLVASDRAGHELINLCVWVKTNGGMGSLYRSRHELVLVLRNGDAQHINNVQLGRFGRNRTNVWNYPGVNSFARKGRENELVHHPTVKPVALVADAIMDCTKRGDTVLDPFLGSGTTLLAAERTGRRCCGIELDPIYLDTAVSRWERMTGGVATHSSGGTFAELKAERGLS